MARTGDHWGKRKRLFNSDKFSVIKAVEIDKQTHAQAATAFGISLTNAKCQSIVIIFFPPNATSECQPMDQGIIRSIKASYGKYMLKELCEYELWTASQDYSDSNQFLPHDHTNLRNVIKWIRDAHCNLTPKIIERYWVNTNVLPVLVSAEANNNRSCVDSCFVDQSINDLSELLVGIRLQSAEFAASLDLAEPDACKQLLQFDASEIETCDLSAIGEDALVQDVPLLSGVTFTEVIADEDDEPISVVTIQQAIDSVVRLHEYLACVLGVSRANQLLDRLLVAQELLQLQRALLGDRVSEQKCNSKQTDIATFSTKLASCSASSESSPMDVDHPRRATETLQRLPN